jgi:prepilin-type N-terminal cleavage/methylation domain-containing protein
MLSVRIKRSFTLLEMAIALALLSVIGTVVGVSVKKLIDSHRFESSLLSLFNELQQAQLLSSAYDAEVAVDLFEEGGAFVACLHTEEPGLKRYIATKRELTRTAAITFNGKKVSSLHMDIYSGGRIVPRGVFAFFDSLQDKPRVLYLDTSLGGLATLSYSKPTESATAPIYDKPVKL